MAARRNDPDPYAGLLSSSQAIDEHTTDPAEIETDENAEANLLGHILAGTVNPTDIPADHFAHPKHHHIHAAAARAAEQGTVDPLTVVRELQESGTFIKVVQIAGNAYPFDLYANRAGHPDYWRRLCAEAAERRRLLQAGRRFVQRLEHGHSPDDVNDALWTAFAELHDPARRTTTEQAPTPDLDTFLNTPEPAHDWLIPGFLERTDRLMLTGGEGHGKTSLLRHWAVQAAAGIHPFTYERIDPIRVLVLDLENSTRQNRREYRPLRAKAGHALRPNQLLLEHRLDGIDLTTDADRAWLDQLVAATKPDLLITGPIYKLANGDPTEEKSAKPVAMHLDRLRADHGVTVILEAHAAKALGGAKKRAHEPYGWSGWLRWPEFGLWLDQDGGLSSWRGQRDATRVLPVGFTRGGEWPWTVLHDEAEIRWQKVRSAVLSAGRKLTHRELEDATGLSSGTLRRTLNTHQVDYIDLLDSVGAELEEGD